MTPIRAVLDTNIIVSAFRSKQGASYRLLEMIEQGKLIPCLSVPLVIEYESVSKRLIDMGIPITSEIVDTVIDSLCLMGEHHQIHYLLRPVLNDPQDDMVLELAVNSDCGQIVTYNVKDFVGAARFGVEIIIPKDLLQRLEG